MSSPQSTPLSTPLSEPLYGATFTQAVSRFFRRATRFKGLSSRSEYWWPALCQFLIAVLFSVLLVAVGGSDGINDDTDPSAGTVVISLIAGIISLLLIVPNLSVTWRRLHDAGFAGPWYFVQFIPVIGSVALLILCLLPSNPARHKPVWG